MWHPKAYSVACNTLRSVRNLCVHLEKTDRTWAYARTVYYLWLMKNNKGDLWRQIKRLQQTNNRYFEQHREVTETETRPSNSILGLLTNILPNILDLPVAISGNSSREDYFDAFMYFPVFPDDSIANRGDDAHG